MIAEQTSNTKRVLLIIGGVALLALVFAIGRMSVDHAAPEHVHDEDDVEAPDERTEVWTCSMHPQVRQPEPGSCPICGMDLIRVEDDEDEFLDDDEVVRLRVSPRAAALMDIRTWPVERRAIEVEVGFFSKLTYDERRVVDVVARSDAYIEKLYANYMWKPLEKGQPLAELYSPDVVAAMRELLVARERGHKETLNATRARLVRLGVSEDQIQAILDSGEAPRTYQARSPIDGALKEMGGHEGHWLAEGEHLSEIVDLSTLWLELEAYETDLRWLRPGQTAGFTIQAVPGETFEGTVAFIHPVIDPRTRTARVRIDVPNPEGLLKPGMFARGTVLADVRGHGPTASPSGLETAETEPPLLIPRTAPLITGRRAVVYIKDPEADRPTFEPREVVLGPRAGDYYVVREGLEEGALVVVHGQFKIDSELQIRGRPSMMAPEGGRPPGHDHGPMEHDHAEREDRLEVVGVRVWEGEVDEAFSRQIASLLESYLTLSDAMAADDFEASMAALRVMHDRLLEVDGKLLEGEARSIWEELEAALHHPQHEMIEKEDLEALRKPFEPLTRAMVRAVEGFGGEAVGEVYVMNCPMAFDFEGADWLQTDDEVRNPYFGAAMLRCGEVRRRL